MASEITSLTIVYSTVYSGTDQRKHQSSASLAFVWGIHRWPVNSPHKWPVARKMFSLDDVIMDVMRLCIFIWKSPEFRGKWNGNYRCAWKPKEHIGRVDMRIGKVWHCTALHLESARNYDDVGQGVSQKATNRQSGWVKSRNHRHKILIYGQHSIAADFSATKS